MRAEHRLIARFERFHARLDELVAIAGPLYDQGGFIWRSAMLPRGARSARIRDRRAIEQPELMLPQNQPAAEYGWAVLLWYVHGCAPAGGAPDLSDMAIRPEEIATYEKDARAIIEPHIPLNRREQSYINFEIGDSIYFESVFVEGKHAFTHMAFWSVD